MTISYILIISVGFLLITGRFARNLGPIFIYSAGYAGWNFYFPSLAQHFIPNLVNSRHNTVAYVGATFVAVFIYYQMLSVADDTGTMWAVVWIAGAAVMLFAPGIAMTFAVVVASSL